MGRKTHDTYRNINHDESLDVKLAKVNKARKKDPGSSIPIFGNRDKGYVVFVVILGR